MARRWLLARPPWLPPQLLQGAPGERRAAGPVVQRTPQPGRVLGGGAGGGRAAAAAAAAAWRRHGREGSAPSCSQPSTLCQRPWAGPPRCHAQAHIGRLLPHRRQVPRDPASGRVAAYVALHGHGTYPRPGRVLRHFFLGNDLCSGRGPVWRPRRVVLLPPLHEEAAAAPGHGPPAAGGLLWLQPCLRPPDYRKRLHMSSKAARGGRTGC
jgi:hypothetical protein